jgi:thymidylate synthase (FAD)
MVKHIDASYNLFNEINQYKLAELAGRVCYKSEDKITDESYKSFITTVMKRGHEAVLEHGTIYFKTSEKFKPLFDRSNYITTVYNFNDGLLYGVANFRAMRNFIKQIANPANLNVIIDGIDDLLFKDIEQPINTRSIVCYVIPLKEFKQVPGASRYERKSVKFICDRAIANEIVRHRPPSYAQESTRYCNYGKTGGISVITSDFYRNNPIAQPIIDNAYKVCEEAYLALLELGFQAQDAREVLPLGLKTEIFVTCNIIEWEWIFGLRCDNAAHPEIRKLMTQLKLEMLK